MSDYRMRGWQNVLLTYVYWEAGGAPDWTGSQSGYPEAQIDDAVVVEVIPTGGGTTPGEGGGAWEFPFMTTVPYNPPAIDIDGTTHPDPGDAGYLIENGMTEGGSTVAEDLFAMPSHWSTGDLSLMDEYP